MRAPFLLFLLTTFSLVMADRPGLAQENVEVYGFVLVNFAGRTTGQRPGGDEGGNFLLAEERLRLDIGAWSESIEASVRVKGDVVHDAVAGEFNIDLREAYIDYTTDSFDLRLGRQVATWGVGDLLFINDVFPKDWGSFFSGRPQEYLKLGVDGLRTRYSSDAFNAELFVIPLFTPDNMPNSERFFLFDPFADVALRDERRPAKTTSNTELALRLYRKIGGFDISAFAYRGFWRSPSMMPDSFTSPTHVTTFYPDLYVYGLSAQGNALGGVLSFETGYYDSRDDNDGDDPTVPNSHVRFLVGYQRQLWQDSTFGLQYYVEIMEDHTTYRGSLPSEFPAQEEYRDTATMRLEQLLQHQRWKLSLFAFFGLVDRDYLIQPQVSYKLSDEISATLGANVFGGRKETTFLGQLDKDDNAFFSARFDF